MDQVVGDFMKPVQAGQSRHCSSSVPRDVPLSVLPDHQRRWYRRVVLRGHVNPVVALHAPVQLAGVHELLGDPPLGHARPRVRERAVGGHVGRPAESLAVDEVVEPVRFAARSCPVWNQRFVPEIRRIGSDRLIVGNERRFAEASTAQTKSDPFESNASPLLIAASPRRFTNASRNSEHRISTSPWPATDPHRRPLHRMCASWKQRHAGDDSDDQDAVAYILAPPIKKAGF